jgi:hypothetical protein
MATLNPKESGPNALTTVETAKLIVNQPPKMQELNELLLSLEGLEQRVSEKTGEDKSQDMGAAGAAAGKAQGATQQSARDQAIAAMPTSPDVLRKDLTLHIGKEVHKLQKLAHQAARRTGKPGDAFRLNQIYARIRRLNALLGDLVHASIEILRRLFIRVFIDRQPIL